MANDNLEDLKNCKRPAQSSNSEVMDIDDLIQENGKHCNGHFKNFNKVIAKQIVHLIVVNSFLNKSNSKNKF